MLLSIALALLLDARSNNKNKAMVGMKQFISWIRAALVAVFVMFSQEVLTQELFRDLLLTC